MKNSNDLFSFEEQNYTKNISFKSTENEDLRFSFENDIN